MDYGDVGGAGAVETGMCRCLFLIEIYSEIYQNVDFGNIVIIINPLPEAGNGGRSYRPLQIR